MSSYAKSVASSYYVNQPPASVLTRRQMSSANITGIFRSENTTTYTHGRGTDCLWLNHNTTVYNSIRPKLSLLHTLGDFARIIHETKVPCFCADDGTNYQMCLYEYASNPKLYSSATERLPENDTMYWTNTMVVSNGDLPSYLASVKWRDPESWKQKGNSSKIGFYVSNNVCSVTGAELGEPLFFPVEGPRNLTSGAGRGVESFAGGFSGLTSMVVTLVLAWMVAGRR
ncbi:hypothetical protein HDV05_000006 [Chytridiales sp. JEL 0842]|nr:hypothetical protein HDV05_000006 [Chytridiales sp. JEL 0842]